MPSFVKVPRNDSVLRQFGPYTSTMSIGEASTSLQRNVRDRGLSDFEPGTQATLLTLVQLATSVPIEFFDVGGHCGMHSVLIASVYPANRVRVTAFEPTPHTSAVFRSLAAANQLPIRIERSAVSVADGTAELYISPWDTSNSLTKGFRPAQDVVNVPTVSLDGYCGRRGVYPDVVKIDVETFEAQVLLGGVAAFERSRPSIVCEMLPHADPQATARALAALDGLGYHMHKWMREDGWQPCTAQDIVDQVFHFGRDWLFTPNALDDRFDTALREWRAAVAECTADTTVVVRRDRSTTAPARYELAAPHGVAGLVRRVSGSLARVSAAGVPDAAAAPRRVVRPGRA